MADGPGKHSNFTVDANYEELERWYSLKRLGSRQLDIFGGSFATEYLLIEGGHLEESSVDHTQCLYS